MTMPYWGTVPCGLCGTETEFTGLLSTHSIGSSDLDTRSPAMHGIVLEAQVQRCPGCGYCSSDVSVAQPEAQAVIARPEYQDLLNDPTYPKLATSFLCKAILNRESKDFAKATWALICAAWVCDDSNYVEQAIACRHKAADMLVLAEEQNQTVTDQNGMSAAILVDLLRRSGQVDQARKVIAARLGGIVDGLIKLILYYQIDLLNKNDFTSHTMAEAQSRFKQNGPEIVAKSKSQPIADAPKNPIDKIGGEPDAQGQEVTVGKRSEQFGSDLNKDTDSENIWSESDVRDFTWEDHQREMENEKFLAHVQKFRDVLHKDGVDAAGAYLEREIKAEEEAKKNKAMWDGIIKIVGVALVTVFIVAKCSGQANDKFAESPARNAATPIKEPPTKDAAKAVAWLLKGAEQGNADAQFRLGMMYDNGNGVAKDSAQAVAWWRKAAKQRDARAQTGLGYAYSLGIGVPKDAVQAVAWFRKAAEQGFADAQSNLGLMYEEGNGVPKDAVQAVAWFRKAAEQGDVESQFKLGFAYGNGYGVPKDLAQAVVWFRKAAEQGDEEAQFNLGVAYLNGYGVPKGHAQAVTWYRKAAEQGNVGAQNYLGWAYDSGNGVPKDAIQAVAWYRKAAEQGFAEAQSNLGSMYASGEGVPRDFIRAYMWFNLAASQGQEEASRYLETVAKRMSPEELTEAKRLTREWRPGSS